MGMNHNNNECSCVLKMNSRTTLVALFITVFLSVITWGYGQDSKLVYTAIVSVYIIIYYTYLFHVYSPVV